MVCCYNTYFGFKSENNLISMNERQKCHRWWSPMELFKNVCFFYDFITTGLFANKNKIQNDDGISDSFKRTKKKKQQKRHLLVHKITRKTNRKLSVNSNLPKLKNLEKSCRYYQGKPKLTKRYYITLSDLRLIGEQNKSENVLRSALYSNNLCEEIIGSNGGSIQLAPKNARCWLLHKKHAYLKNRRYCISLRNKDISFQLLVECSPMDLVKFLFFCAQTLATVKFDVPEISSCGYSIPALSLNQNDSRDVKIKCLIYDTVYKFTVRNMEDTGASVATPITQQQQHSTIPVYSATKTISNLLLNNKQLIAMKSRVSSIVGNDTKKSLTWRENDTVNGNDDSYYQDALKRYRKGGTETLKRVNAEMSKTLKDGVGTLNNINLRVREYLNEMECTDKTLNNKINIDSSDQIENGRNSNLGDSYNNTEDLRRVAEATVHDTTRTPTKSSINENKEVHEIIEIDKILKTEMENKPELLEHIYQVMRHIDNIDEYRNIVINYNNKKKDSDQNRQMTETTEKKLEVDANIIDKMEKNCNKEEEIIDKTFEFAQTVNSQPQNIVQIKSVEYESDDDGNPEILHDDEKNMDWNNQICKSAKEKKKRKIKIITKKSMLSNTTIIEVQSPKTCNKTREEKLEELIKALSKKSGDERIRQIMEFLQEQTVSTKPFQSDLIEDIPRIRALTNIHGRLKEEELARDSLFEFQRKMCVTKKAKPRIKLPSALPLTKTTLHTENKKKLVHLRAQELYVPDRQINRLTKIAPSDHKKEKDIHMGTSEAHVRPKGRVAKYLEKRRKRLIHNALDYKRSHHNSATIQQFKTATITMPKDPITIKKTLEKKASSKSDCDRAKSTLQLNFNEKNDFSNCNRETKEIVPLKSSNNPSKTQLSINAKSEIGSATLVVHDSKNNKTNQKFFDLKDNPDYSRNPVEDYTRDKHKWLRHKTDSSKSSKNTLYCFDILDEITPNDVLPLKSEYPRRDNILPDKIPHPCESFLGKLINRGNRKVLEALLKVETPKVVCSTPNCITCRIKDSHTGKRSKIYNKKSTSSERSFSSTDETASVKKKKNHLLLVTKHAKKDNAISQITTVENSNEFKLKNFLKGRQLVFSNNGSIAKAKSTRFEGAKKERLRKIHSDRSRSSSQRTKRHKPKNVKLNVTKALGHSNETNNSSATSYKKNIDSFTRQEVEEKLKQYMVDPYLHYPTSVTIMPVSVVYHTFDNTNGNPRMMRHSTTRVPFVQQHDDHTKTPLSQNQQRSLLTLDQNPSYIFTSTTQDGETFIKHKSQFTNNDTSEKRTFKDKNQRKIDFNQNQQKKIESAELTEFSSEQNKTDLPPRRLRKGTVTRGFAFDKRQCRNEEYNKKSTSLTEMEQPISKIKNQKSMLNEERAEAGIILPKIICKRSGVKSAPSKYQSKGKTQKKLNLPTTETITSLRPPLKKIKDKNRNVHFKDDIQKVIQSVEFKMVDILSDPRKHNVDSFMDVEKEITSVLAKFKTDDKTIEEEEGTTTTTTTVDAYDEMKETYGSKRSCLLLDYSGSNSNSNSTTTDAAVSSSLSTISKKDKQILTDIYTVVKKKSRKKMNSTKDDKKQVSKINIPLQTTSTKSNTTSLSCPKTVEASKVHRKLSVDNATEKKINTDLLAQAKQKTIITSVTPDEEKKEPIPYSSFQTRPRSKGPLTNSGMSLPSSSGSFLPQHLPGSRNLRRRKSQTPTCLRTFSPPSGTFVQSSSRSRPFSITMTKVDDKTHDLNRVTQLSHSETTNDNTNTITSTSHRKKGKGVDKPKIMEISPNCETQNTMALINSSMKNVCDIETEMKKSGGSGDEGDIATVFRDHSEINLLEDNVKTVLLDENDNEAILEENAKSTVIDIAKSWTDTDLTAYTDSFHVPSNSASFNVTRHTEVNLEVQSSPTTDEKCFITAAYEPKPHLSEKIDATLAKIEVATRTIEEAMKSAENIDAITQEVEREPPTNNHSECVWEMFRENMTNLWNQHGIIKGEGDNIVNGKGEHYDDNILYFLDNLTTLTAESNAPLPITITKGKFTALSFLSHICNVYYETAIFYGTDTYNKVYLSECQRINYQQVISQLLDQTETYAQDKYIYNRDMEMQSISHKRNRALPHEFERQNVNLTNGKENNTYKTRILDLFYGLLFTLLYFGLIFNYVCHFIE